MANIANRIRTRISLRQNKRMNRSDNAPVGLLASQLIARLSLDVLHLDQRCIMTEETVEARKPMATRFVWVAVIFFSVVAFFWAVDYAANGPDGIAFRHKFRSVTVGMDENAVLTLLGEPDDRSNEFYLGQYPGFEAAYRRAAESDSSCYLIYNRGIDLVYAVGVDEQGSVTLKEVGGT